MKVEMDKIKILLEIVTQAQSVYISSNLSETVENAFKKIIEGMKNLTGSKHAFITRVDRSKENSTIYVLTPLASSDSILHEEMAQYHQSYQFCNETLTTFQSLICQILQDKKSLIINKLTPVNHYTRDALVIKNFLGLPLIFNDELIGIAGIANTFEEDFDETTIPFILPIIQSCVLILEDQKVKEAYHEAIELLKIKDDALSMYLQKLEVQNQELEIARHIALSSNRAKSIFLANISHELRTPLNGILGMTELLRYTTLDPKQKKYADTIYSAGEVLLELINDVFDVSKIETGEFKIEETVFDLYQLIHELLSLYTIQAQNKQIKIVLDYQEELPHQFISDPYRIRQILSILIDNAIKYTTKGFVSIKIKKIKEYLNGKSFLLKFEISDTGIGMSPDTLQQVFKKFFQEPEVAQKLGGKGLGLFICKQLVEKMGGVIGVESKLGTGSIFWIDLTLSLPQKESQVENLSK